MMLSLKSEDDFRRTPSGGYVSRETWLYFSVDATLFGFVLWETPSPEDVAALVRLLEIELDRPPHVALVDTRRLRAVSPSAFVELATYFERHSAALARTVTRSAIVLSEGLTGAVAAGFLATVPPTFSATYSTSPADALRSLDVPDAALVADAIDKAYEEAASLPAFVRAMHSWLETNLLDATLQRAAVALALAPRTLQRRLAEAGTSFLDEVGKARVRVGQRMITQTDTPLTRIALEVGCASSQQFSALFRKHTGETPTSFRQRTRPS